MYTDPPAIVVQAIAPVPATIEQAIAMYAVKGPSTREECIVLLRLIKAELEKVSGLMDDVMARCEAVKAAEEANGRLAESG